jgi:transposase-like protein
MSKNDTIIHLDEAQLREHLDRKLTESVEETLNGLLNAEADRLCGAGRHERSADRLDTVLDTMNVNFYTLKQVKKI